MSTPFNRLTASFLAGALLAAFAACSQPTNQPSPPPPAPPAEPESLEIGSPSAVRGNREVALSWTDPTWSTLAEIRIAWEPGAGSLVVDPGVERATVTGLTNDVEYAFTLTATSASGESGPPVVVTAMPEPTAPWATSASVEYRRRLAVDNRSRSDFLFDFPLLVRLDATRIDYDQTDGSDLRFFAADNTELFYEIERWDETGESIVWVRLPSVGAGVIETVWMYWGSGVASVANAPAEVWREYELVLHLDDLTDSSPRGYDGVAWDGAGTPLPTADHEAGAVGLGVRLSGGGQPSSVDVPGYAAAQDGTTVSAYTVEIWMRATSAPAQSNTSGPLNGDRYFNLGWDNSSADAAFRGAYTLASPGDLTLRAVPRGDVGGGTWYYWVARFDGGASGGVATSFRNGSAEGVLSGVGPTTNDRVSYLRLGTALGPGHFRGVVDEVRIAHVARSSDWIQAQYDSMRDAMVRYSIVEAR